MTLYLKTCIGWAVVAIFVYAVLISIALYSNNKIWELEGEKQKGVLIILDGCVYKGEAWQLAFCSPEYIQKNYYFYEGAAVLCIILTSIMLFIYTNSKKHWIGWKGCD